MARQPSAGILLFDVLHVGEDLVAADVERAERHRAAQRRVDHVPVKRLLLGDPRKMRGKHELQLGAEQSDRLRARLMHMRHVQQQAGVHVQAERDPVGGDVGRVAQGAILVLAARAQARRVGVRRLDVRRWSNRNHARLPVDNDRIPGFDDFRNVPHAADDRNAHRPRDDGDMAVRRTLFEREAAQPRPVVVEQRRGAHRAGDENGVLRKFARREHQFLAGKLMQQPIGDVGEVVEAIAHVRIGLPLQLRARVVLHALDRSFGGQAAADRLSQAAQPTAVMGDHSEGFEDLAMLPEAPSPPLSISASTDARIASIAEFEAFHL